LSLSNSAVVSITAFCSICSRSTAAAVFDLDALPMLSLVLGAAFDFIHGDLGALELRMVAP